MSNEEIRILIYLLLTIIVCMYTMYYMNRYFLKIKIREISEKNKLNFIRLQKNYLNKVSNEDIEDLIIFLYIKLIERNSKNE